MTDAALPILRAMRDMSAYASLENWRKYPFIGRDGILVESDEKIGAATKEVIEAFSHVLSIQK
jgi:hypothetical protein